MNNAMNNTARIAALLMLASPAMASLAACATAPGQEAALRASVGSPPLIDLPPNPDASLLGLYLAGNQASKDGRNEAAADYFARAADLVDDDGALYLREKAFVAAAVAGEIERAAQLAPPAGQGGVATQRLAKLVLAVDALAKGEGAAANTILKTDDIGQPYRSAALLLRPWAAIVSGEIDALGAAHPEGGRNDRLSASFTQLNRALVLEHLKRPAEAREAFDALIGGDIGMRMFNINYGEFLERQGARSEAIAIYDDLLKQHPDDRTALYARNRAASRRAAPPPAPSAQQGAAQALLTAATAAMSQSATETAQIYVQLALRLDPHRPEALLLAGGFAEQIEDYDVARGYYARVPAKSPEYLDARARTALTYRLEDNLPKAVEVARESARMAPNDRNTEVNLADLLRTTKDYDGAIRVLSKVISNRAHAPDWRLLYSRAVAYEQAGRWHDAEKDLIKALAIEPDQPDVLNYLGYSWADRGEHLDQAVEMLQKAVRAQPNSGAIVDSLGWAYFRKDDIPQAIELLERAVELSPSDPDINDHLGDAYARTSGRRLEAVFQWERVLTLEADDELKAKVRAKLAREKAPPTIAVAPTDPVTP